LGVCYSIIAPLYIATLIFWIRRFLDREAKKDGKLIPSLSIIFLALCVFRAVFLFGYPSELFGALSEFVVFEIPTFLLFTAVIVCIYFWKVIVHMHEFQFKHDDRLVVALGILFVWSLWVIVTVVYAKVILDDTSGSTPCAGRVPISYSKQESNTRKLAIAYQAVIIAITFTLSSIFFYFTIVLVRVSQRLSSAKQFIIIVGGIICFCFLMRCIFFIIVLSADFVSNIYMFIVLFLTEVLMLFVLGLELNLRLFQAFQGFMSRATTLSSGGSKSGQFRSTATGTGTGSGVSGSIST